MWKSARTALLCSLGLLVASTTAFAAPPRSCAWKFVGVWIHHGPFGITNRATLTPDGRALCGGNSACRQGTWTCYGNTEIYSNGISNTAYTLQPNGTTMTGRGGSLVVTRVGPPPRRLQRPRPSSATAKRPRSRHGRPPVVISSQCIKVERPHRTLIGCAPGKQWVETKIRAVRGVGCPHEPSVRISGEPGTTALVTSKHGGYGRWTFTTCGHGITRDKVQIVQSRY